MKQRSDELIWDNQWIV